jgi:hypothetical protein
MSGAECPACGGSINMFPAGTALPQGRCTACNRQVVIHFDFTRECSRIEAYDASVSTPIALTEQPLSFPFGAVQGTTV